MAERKTRNKPRYSVAFKNFLQKFLSKIVRVGLGFEAKKKREKRHRVAARHLVVISLKVELIWSRLVTAGKSGIGRDPTSKVSSQSGGAHARLPHHARRQSASRIAARHYITLRVKPETEIYSRMWRKKFQTLIQI